MTRPRVLKIRDLTLEFPTYRGAVKALAAVSLDVHDGEIVGLVGESGCGKSVTAMSVVQLLPERKYRVTRGSILLQGEDMLSKDDRELQSIRGNVVSMIFQEPMNALNPTIKIGKQLIRVIRRHTGLTRSRARGLAVKLLQDMQIPDAESVMGRYPFELSGGMRQRVLIALAFSCEPQLLIADEPTTALDVTIQAQVLLLLRNKAKDTGTSVLFITHDLAVISQLCDRTYVMYAGTIVEHGRTAHVLRHPAHPYTQALLRSLPERSQPRRPLVSIRGTVPNLLNPPSGCRFRVRCPLAQDSCMKAPPLLATGEDVGHSVACWVRGSERGEVG